MRENRFLAVLKTIGFLVLIGIVLLAEKAADAALWLDSRLTGERHAKDAEGEQWVRQVTLILALAGIVMVYAAIEDAVRWLLAPFRKLRFRTAA